MSNVYLIKQSFDYVNVKFNYFETLIFLELEKLNITVPDDFILMSLDVHYLFTNISLDSVK